ncbi:MAG: hypothetical protein ABEJ42_00830 [Halobacteriaceae archaeon]
MADQGVHIGEHPRYWAYDGEPTLLLGGSSQDNLFQVPGVEHQLDRIAEAGGNYVRNTMSARNRRESVLRWGADNVWPFERVRGSAGPTAEYDLDRWNDAYWDRFESFVEACAMRDIVVQVEVWATFDYYRQPWDENPFNPPNNVNYSLEESGLYEEVTTSPTGVAPDTQPFFYSVPAELDLATLREYQHRFVDKVLAHATPYGNVLYCLDNETSAPPTWSAYWADYLHDATEERVYVTEMLWEEDAEHPQHDATVDDPARYDSLEASQNSKIVGREHYENGLRFREHASDPPRPVNNVKIYGTGDGTQINFTGSEHDAVHRFWRNIFAGHAAARFHRPPYGIGINARAERMLRSARDVEAAVDLLTCEPRPDLLELERVAGTAPEADGPDAPDEAYLLADPGEMYAVYFPRGGGATLQAPSVESCRWYDVEGCDWHDEDAVEPASDGAVSLRAPYERQWVAVLE